MASTIEQNKALVLEAMTALFQRRDAKAVERLYAPDYIQHNPSIPQGRAALAELVAQLPPDLFYEPGLMIAEGAYVAIHGRIRGWAPAPQVVIDVFRIDDGLLAEHWDVLQDEVAADATPSGISMFSPDERARQVAETLSNLPKAGAAIDYDSLMRANLMQVFGERDAHTRMSAIRRLYAADAVLNEPHASAKGHAEINDAVTALLATLPLDFSFRVLGAVQGHHGIGVLKWGSGPRDGAFAVTGMDVAHFQDGVIHSLFVFLTPPGA
jgi:predicted SnoaL-like aldol condensation-catalyzing enzyme